MTIPKGSNKAKQVLASARNIRCFSLGNNFSGTPLAEQCCIWGGPIVDGHRYRDLLTVSQQEFLAHELHASRSTKLHVERHGYSITVHSNLWYEFEA